MEKCVNYDKALTDNEILLYSKMIDKFKKREINFSILKNMFLDYGISIEPITIEPYKQILTITEAEMINKRYAEQNFIYEDINYFILNSENFKNISFRIDYKAIEILANNGYTEYQEKLISILIRQLEKTYDSNDELTAERNKWRRKVAELQEELSKNNNYTKSK